MVCEPFRHSVCPHSSVSFQDPPPKLEVESCHTESRTRRIAEDGEQVAREEPLLTALFRSFMVVWTVDLVAERRSQSAPVNEPER